LYQHKVLSNHSPTEDVFPVMNAGSQAVIPPLPDSPYPITDDFIYNIKNWDGNRVAWLAHVEHNVLQQYPPTSLPFDQWLAEFDAQHDMPYPELFRFLAKEATGRQLVAFYLSEANFVGFFARMVLDSHVQLKELISDIHLPPAAKDKALKSVWDNYIEEIGGGVPGKEHIAVFRRDLKGLASLYGKELTFQPPGFHTENLALFSGYLTTSSFKLIGALGNRERSAEGRFGALIAGFNRLGIKNFRTFIELHYEVDGGDEGHGQVWRHDVQIPLATASQKAFEEFRTGMLTHLAVETAYYRKLLPYLRSIESSEEGHVLAGKGIRSRLWANDEMFPVAPQLA